MSQQIPNKVPIFSFPVWVSPPLFLVARSSSPRPRLRPSPVANQDANRKDEKAGGRPAVPDCDDGINLCAINDYIRPCRPTGTDGGASARCTGPGKREIIRVITGLGE
jgi:hypothetical protein